MKRGRAQRWGIQCVWAVIMWSNRKWNWAQLSVAVSASHWNTWRGERAQSRCDVGLHGFRKSDQSGKHGFSCFSSFFVFFLFHYCCKVDVNKLWARVFGQVVWGGQVWRSSILFLDRHKSHLVFWLFWVWVFAHDENHRKDVSGFLEKYQSLLESQDHSHRSASGLLGKGRKKKKTEKNTFLSFLSVSSENWK